MPQYLIIYKCFQLSAWVFIIGTFTIFLMVHRKYEFFQMKHFKRLYSSTDLIQHERISTFLKMYGLFLCVSQPRLIHEKFASGKILLTIFGFTALILATIFQSRAIYLMRDPIRNQDIDTLEELKDSDLLLQVTDLIEYKKYFDADTQLNWVGEKLTDSYKFETMYISFGIVDEYDGTIDNSSVGVAMTTMLQKSIGTGLRSLQCITESDGFLAVMSVQAPENYAFATFDNPDKPQALILHNVREGIINYPVMYLMPKHSFFRDVMNEFLTQAVESGLYLKISREYKVWDSILSSYADQANEPKPSTLTDLQMPFTYLIVGLSVSCCVFLLELTWRFTG